MIYSIIFDSYDETGVGILNIAYSKFGHHFAPPGYFIYLLVIIDDSSKKFRT